MKSKELAPPEFVHKVKAKMIVENLGVTQLARKINVSHPTITELVTYGYKPSFDTCKALSPWLGQSVILTLREAALLPPGMDEDIKWEDWKHLITQLTPQEEQNIKRMTEVTIESRQKSEQAERSKSFKPSKVKK